MFGYQVWKQAFDRWEGATSQVLEQWLRNPVVLEPAGLWLSTLMRLKATADKASASWWGGLGLPTKRDQERTLHLINRLESRILDLEERLAERQG